MANFVVTFRIHSDSTYQNRYDSFVEEVRKIAGNVGSTWEETSSFFAFAAEGSAESICDQIYYGSTFDGARDLMVVIDLTARKKAIKGGVKYPNTLTACLGF